MPTKIAISVFERRQHNEIEAARLHEQLDLLTRCAGAHVNLIITENRPLFVQYLFVCVL
jgi:hypothetical protein